MLSSNGFIYDFLKVGINQNKSINIINITEIIGCFKNIQKIIDINQNNKLTLSKVVIFFSHFFTAINTIIIQNNASNKVIKLQYHQSLLNCIQNHINNDTAQIIQEYK